MKKTLFLLLVLFFFNSLFFQCVKKEEAFQPKTKIALVNPSASSLKSFLNLVNHKIIDIPDPQLTVVTYSRYETDYEAIAQNLNDSRARIYFRTIDGELTRDNLFQENPCSDSFYDVFKNTDGIIFFGGADLQPIFYSQKTSLLTKIATPYRHLFEISFLFHLLGGYRNEDFRPYLEEKPDYVVYGFCLGMQTINVATGGTLYQDIPWDIYGIEYVEDVLGLNRNLIHKNYWTNLGIADDLNRYNFHKIKLSDNRFFVTKLKRQPAEQPLVLSSHHQAVKEIGKNLQIAATSLDGRIVEALTHKKYPNVLGVQFHPEVYALYDSAGNNYRFSPYDSLSVNDYELLKKDNSLRFHYDFWKYFSHLF